MENKPSIPQITTVIPTYKRPSKLKRAIVSAAQQLGISTKVAVFDNHSLDETEDVVNELQKTYSQIIYHCHPENIGALGNFIHGVGTVDTPFFSILSDDDYLLPDFYRRAIDDLNDHPEAMFWVGLGLHFDESKNIIDARVQRWSKEGIYTPPEAAYCIAGGLLPVWTSIVFRREILDDTGFIDTSMLGVMDYEFLLRLSLRYPLILRKHPSAAFFISQDTYSGSQPLSSFWPGWKKMFKKLECYSETSKIHHDNLSRMLRHSGERMLFRRGVNAIVHRRYDFAKDASTALKEDCGKLLTSSMLSAATIICEHSNFAHKIFSLIYRNLEKRLINSRRHLQDDFGHLLDKL